MTVTILTGDALAVLKTLPDQSVHLIVTSPPYYQQRSYLKAGDPLKALEMGLEDSPAEFVSRLVALFREARRVLRDDGCLFVNIGDTAASGGRGGGGSFQHEREAWAEKSEVTGWRDTPGVHRKSKLLIPFRFALAMQDDGWVVRQDNIWFKRNCFPESISDRTTTAHEYVFHFAKPGKTRLWRARDNGIWSTARPDLGERIPNPSTNPEVVKTTPTVRRWLGFHYYYEADEVAEASSPNSHARVARGRSPDAKFGDGGPRQQTIAGGKPSAGRIRNGVGPKPAAMEDAGRVRANGDFLAAVSGELLPMRNMRSVWEVQTAQFTEAHFACVDDQTEALTRDGWKPHGDLHDGEYIAAFNRTSGLIQWEVATIHRYPFSGELVAIEKASTSQRLTPNHRCLVRDDPGGKTRVVLAENLKPSMYLPLCQPLHEEPQTNGVGIDMATLLGWYVTEGEVRRGRTVRLSQSPTANPENCASIRRLLTGMKAAFTEKTRHRTWRGRPSDETVFSIRDGVAMRLSELSPKKQIDPAWMRWPNVDIHAFVEAVIRGDGHRRKDDGRCCVVQKDPQFLGQLQAMMLRLNRRSVVTQRRDGRWVLYESGKSWVTLRGTDGVHNPLGREFYEGTVWCPSVPSAYWLARRAGKPFITGNTYPTALVDPIIRAACPPGGVVLDPFGGAGTTAVAADRAGRNCILIELDPKSAEIARRRLHADAGMFADVGAG